MFGKAIVRPLSRRASNVARPALALTLAASLGACGAAKAPEQLIVKGDKFEITLQEYDQLLRRFPPVTKDAVAPLRRALLQQLIDEKLLADAAVGAGIENDPNSSQAIAAARRTILAQAYVQSLTGHVPKPSDSAVQAYYANHPAQFGNRRRFVVEEYVLRSDMPDLKTYLDALDQSDFAVLSALVAQKAPGIHSATVVRFTDELPESRPGALDALTTGSNIVYQAPGQVHLGRILSATPEPIALEAARGRIEQSLTAERTAAITQAAVKTLRQSRNIEILNANLKAVAGGPTQAGTNS